MWASWITERCCWSVAWQTWLKTFIVRGSAVEIATRAEAAKPAYFDVLPLSLEEIFIYELGGVDYAVKDILL